MMKFQKSISHHTFGYVTEKYPGTLQHLVHDIMMKCPKNDYTDLQNINFIPRLSCLFSNKHEQFIKAGNNTFNKTIPLNTRQPFLIFTNH